MHCRLVNAFAEENATEDAIYYLGEALRKGVIDLDVFLKVCYFLSVDSYSRVSGTCDSQTSL